MLDKYVTRGIVRNRKGKTMDENFYKNNTHATQDFLSTAAATVAGAYVGHKLDQTRFGWWINTNPTVNKLFGLMKILTVLATVGFVMLYFYFFFTAT